MRRPAKPSRAVCGPASMEVPRQEESRGGTVTRAGWEVQGVTSRDDALQRLGDERFDLLVIGGGITGAGIALDAAARGMRVALVERDDFATGTSSRSSKLIHGGLRYLAHLEVGLVREALAERGVLQRLAPFLVIPTPFVVPRIGKRRLLPLRAGLQAYDVLAVGSRFPRHRILDADAARTYGGFLYWDARTDDARLVWTVVRTAADHGAAVVNHAPVTRFLHDARGRASGAVVRDTESGREVEVRARVIVNATGVWSDEVRRMEDPAGVQGIRPSKGVHLTFPASAIDAHSALLVPAPDGRYVFVIPWVDETVIVGTTDDDYRGPLGTPRAEPADIDYLIATVNRVLARPVSRSEVLASWAGLRPLIQRPGQTTKDLSRRHRVVVGAAGIVTITGGKLTAYRPMAADAVDAALEAGGFESRPPSNTASVRLAGGAEGKGAVERIEAGLRRLGLPLDHGLRLYRRYGSRTAEVLGLVAQEPDLAEPLHPSLPYLRAEAAYAMDVEMARRPNDVLSHRLRARITSSDRGVAALDWVTDRLAKAGAWDEDRRLQEAARYRQEVADDVGADQA